MYFVKPLPIQSGRAYTRSPYLKYYESFMHGRRRAPLEYYAELYNSSRVLWD